MNHGTDGDVTQRQVVSGLDVGGGTTFDLVALSHLVRGNDVTLLAIGVVQQSNTRGAVGVVLNVSNGGGNAVLVRTTEVNNTVGTLVAATLVTRSDPTGVVASTLAMQGAHQRLLRLRPRDLSEVGNT